MFSIKSIYAEALMVVMALHLSVIAFAQSDCVALLMAKDGGDISYKVVQTYRHLLFESGASVVGDNDLTKLLERSRTSFDGLFSLDGPESSDRSVVAQGLEQLLGYIKRSVVQKNELALALKTALEDELKLRRTEKGIIDRTREERAILWPHTSTGTIFEPVDWPGLGPALRDPDGLIWSKRLDKASVQHQGEAKNGVVLESEATKMCTEVGGRLPTKEEFERLLSYFAEPSVGWTAQGIKDLRRIFPKTAGYRLWSSSVDPCDSDQAYFFSSLSGIVFLVNRIQFDGAVICVAR